MQNLQEIMVIKVLPVRGHKLYLVGVEFENKSGNIKNCGRWSDMLNETFPKIVLLTSGLGILQNVLSMRVLLFLQTLVGRII